MPLGPKSPCWRYWDPHSPERWRELNTPQELAPDRWHTLRLEGSFQGDRTFYQRFTINGQTRELGITVRAADEPDTPHTIAVAVQLDGNSQQTPYEVRLDQVGLRMDAESTGSEK